MADDHPKRQQKRQNSRVAYLLARHQLEANVLIMTIKEERQMELRQGGAFATLTPEELLGPLNNVEQKYAPPQLFVAGPIEIPLPSPRASIVGSRRSVQERVGKRKRNRKIPSGQRDHDYQWTC